jgi:hypothetical protein
MIAVGLAAAAGTAAYAAPSATAAPQPAAATSSTTLDNSGLVPVFDPNTGASEFLDPDTAARLITAYWTPDQLASATPADLPQDPSTTDTVPDGTPTAVFRPSRTLGSPTLGGRIQTLGPTKPFPGVAPAVGKVVFRDPADGKNHFCSGSALNTPKQRMVLTAAHCVHDFGGGNWMQNWIFEPGFKNGPGSAGVFTPVFMMAWTAATQGGDRHYDYGVVITHINGGGKLVAQTGGNGLIVNPGRPFVTFVGYSTDGISNGAVQEFCQGQLSRKSVFNSDQSLPCFLVPGSSGAPWLQSLSGGFGFVVSNTSYGTAPGGSNPVFGPYYDGDTATLVLSAEAASP